MISHLRAWQRSGFALATAVGLGAVAMVLTYRAVSAWSRARMVVEFERRARTVLGSLQAELDASLELTQAMADVFGATLPIPFGVFEAVTDGARARHPELRALVWVPRVPRGGEAAFEERVRPDLGEFRIVDYPGATPAPPGRDRYPVAYVSPLAPNRGLLGLDLASEPLRRRTLEAAAESGRPVVSPILHYLRGGEGFIVLVPAYVDDRPHGTAAERLAALSGLGLAAYDIDHLAGLAQRAGAPLELDVGVRTGTTAEGDIADVERFTMNSAWTIRSVGGRDQRSLALELIPDQPAAGPDSWYLRISPAAHASWAARPFSPWLGVVGMASLTGFACLLIVRTATARGLAQEVQASNAALAKEIGERKETERALKRHAALVTLSLDSMNLVAWHLDVRSGELTRATAAGPVTTHVPTGGGDRWMSLFRDIRDEDRERVVAYVQDVVARRASECHFEFGTKGGAEGPPRHFMVIGRFQRDEDGRLLSFTGLQADVTERRRIEKEQRQLEEHLENTQRLESLGVLAGGVAHDFNNLIMGIVGGLAVLEKRSGNDAETRRALALIERGATRASELTRQLLAYAGREHAVVEPTSLGELVRDMLPLLETSAGHRMTLALDLEPGVSVVQADATQLRQIVMNLVINAAEAMGASGGTVGIRVGCQRYDRATLAAGWPANDLPGGRYVFVEVRDTGCGMSGETRQRIFEPFFTTKFTGRGLGLAAVLGIVRAHGGAILVESALGTGTTVTVLLPPSGAPATARAREHAAAGLWRGSGTVLIVDDEAIARDVTADMLRALGFGAVVTADGRDALARIDRGDPVFAAVILDLTMPGQSGLEVHRALRRQAPLLPVLLVSGYSLDDARAALDDGAPTGFLQKPYRLADLANALRDLLARRPAA
jgi:signal transduction histidine kinase/CHASE1-domain containing sensor protein